MRVCIAFGTLGLYRYFFIFLCTHIVLHRGIIYERKKSHIKRRDNYAKSRKKRTIEIDKKNIAEELTKIQKSRKNAELPELFNMAQSAIALCNAQYLEEEERKKKREKEKRYAAYLYLVLVKKMQEMEEYAAKYQGTPYADRFKGISAKYLPRALKAMSDTENLEAEQKVNSIELAAEDSLLKECQQKLRSDDANKSAADKADTNAPSVKNQSKTNLRQKSFNEQKAEFSDTIARMLAVQIISNTIKSIKVGMEEMGDVITNEDINKMTDEMLTKERIEDYTEMIKGRDDFTHMMSGVTTVEKLDALRDKALDGSGKQLKDELFKAGQELIKKDMQKEQAAKQAAKKLEEQAGINKKDIPDGPVLRPNDDFMNN